MADNEVISIPRPVLMIVTISEAGELDAVRLIFATVCDGGLRDAEVLDDLGKALCIRS